MTGGRNLCVPNEKEVKYSKEDTMEKSAENNIICHNNMPYHFGLSWKAFIERSKATVKDKPPDIDCDGDSTQSCSTSRLPSTNARVYGLRPSLDDCSLTVCDRCGAIISSHALFSHIDKRHSTIIASDTTPTAQSSVQHLTIQRPLTIKLTAVSNSTSKAKGSPRNSPKPSTATTSIHSTTGTSPTGFSTSGNHQSCPLDDAESGSSRNILEKYRLPSPSSSRSKLISCGAYTSHSGSGGSDTATNNSELVRHLSSVALSHNPAALNRSSHSISSATSTNDAFQSQQEADNPVALFNRPKRAGYNLNSVANSSNCEGRLSPDSPAASSNDSIDSNTGIDSTDISGTPRKPSAKNISSALSLKQKQSQQVCSSSKASSIKSKRSLTTISSEGLKLNEDNQLHPPAAKRKSLVSSEKGDLHLNKSHKNTSLSSHSSPDQSSQGPVPTLKIAKLLKQSRHRSSKKGSRGLSKKSKSRTEPSTAASVVSDTTSHSKNNNSLSEEMESDITANLIDSTATSLNNSGRKQVPCINSETDTQQLSANTATTVNLQNLTTTDSHIPCKDREYDPNRHCGCWLEEWGKHCTRSLTCKSHALSLRRKVTGRSKPFDQLLQEHRDAKEALALAKAAEAGVAVKSTSSSTKTAASNGLMSSTIKHTSTVCATRSDTVNSKSFPPALLSNTSVRPGWLSDTTLFRLSTTEDDAPIEGMATDSMLMYSAYHPRPLMAASYGARISGNGYVPNRQLDLLRSVLSAAIHQPKSQHRRHTSKVNPPSTKINSSSNSQGHASASTRVAAVQRSRSTDKKRRLHVRQMSAAGSRINVKTAASGISLSYSKSPGMADHPADVRACEHLPSTASSLAPLTHPTSSSSKQHIMVAPTGGQFLPTNSSTATGLAPTIASNIAAAGLPTTATNYVHANSNSIVPLTNTSTMTNMGSAATAVLSSVILHRASISSASAVTTVASTTSSVSQTLNTVSKPSAVRHRMAVLDGQPYILTTTTGHPRNDAENRAQPEITSANDTVSADCGHHQHLQLQPNGSDVGMNPSSAAVASRVLLSAVDLHGRSFIDSGTSVCQPSPATNKLKSGVVATLSDKLLNGDYTKQTVSVPSGVGYGMNSTQQQEPLLTHQTANSINPQHTNGMTILSSTISGKPTTAATSNQILAMQIKRQNHRHHTSNIANTLSNAISQPHFRDKAGGTMSNVRQLPQQFSNALVQPDAQLKMQAAASTTTSITANIQQKS